MPVSQSLADAQTRQFLISFDRQIQRLGPRTGKVFLGPNSAPI